MLHFKDIILLLAVFCSMAAGLLWPESAGRLVALPECASHDLAVSGLPESQPQ